MSVRTDLMGYVRRSNNGGALKVSIDQEAFQKAQSYQTSDGRSYVGMIINLTKLRNLLLGEQEVTAINQLVDMPDQEPVS